MIHMPIIRNEEMKFDKQKFMVSKTDLKGNITFVNQNLCEVSGYDENELIGTPHSILRHPDMPKAIFHLMWKRLLSGRAISSVIKNLAKDGRYYWVVSDLKPNFDKDGNIISLISFSRSAPNYVIETIEELYQTMLRIENVHNTKRSIDYLEGYLEEKETTYDTFIDELIKPKGIISFLLNAFK